MQNSLFDPDRILPDALADDLSDLLTWDNNCYLTWVNVGTDETPEGSRWFTVLLSSNGRRFWLSLEFWIPEWMNARGVSALVPAHMAIRRCDDGKQAVVDLDPAAWPDLKRSIPKVARTCARLMTELWGTIDPEDVLLLAIDYQDERLEVPFTELPGYGT